MDKIAIIGGSGFSAYDNKKVFFIERHPDNIPPHKINHKNNLQQIKDFGITSVLGICSVGSLKTEIKPGTLIFPDDFINLHNNKTVHHKRAVHIVPKFDKNLRDKILKSAHSLKIKTINHGTYYQTQGPRFETKAEIKMISQFADIVGMTMANEATIAQELGLNYAPVCVIDNYANGISEELDKEKWQINQTKNKTVISKLLNHFLS